MDKPKTKTPGEILAQIPEATVDLTDETADKVSVSGEHVTPADAIIIGARVVAGIERPDNVSAMVTGEGGLVETKFGQDGKPVDVSYTGPRRIA